MTEKKGIRITKKQFPDSPIELVRGVGIIDAPPMSVVNLFKQFHRRTEWDELVKETTLVEAFGEDTLVMRMAYIGVWPTLPRDFCNRKNN